MSRRLLPVAISWTQGRGWSSHPGSVGWDSDVPVTDGAPSVRENRYPAVAVVAGGPPYNVVLRPLHPAPPPAPAEGAGLMLLCVVTRFKVPWPRLLFPDTAAQRLPCFTADV